MTELVIAPCPMHGEKCQGSVLQDFSAEFYVRYECGTTGPDFRNEAEAAATFAHCQQKTAEAETLKPAEAETELESMAWELWKSGPRGMVDNSYAFEIDLCFQAAQSFKDECKKRRSKNA